MSGLMWRRKNIAEVREVPFLSFSVKPLPDNQLPGGGFGVLFGVKEGPVLPVANHDFLGGLLLGLDSSLRVPDVNVD